MNSTVGGMLDHINFPVLANSTVANFVQRLVDNQVTTWQIIKVQ